MPWWEILAIAALAVCLLSYLMAELLLWIAFYHTDGPRRKRDPKRMTPLGRRWTASILEAKEWLSTQPMERVKITASQDGVSLTGWFLPAKEPSCRVALCIHGYRGDGISTFGPFAAFYQRMGFHLLMPDNRAHGKSGGRYVGFGWADRLDCLDWAAYLTQRLGKEARILLHGVSMGGATVLNAAGESPPPQVRAVVADCGYSSAWEELVHQLKRQYHLPPFPVMYLASLLYRRRMGSRFRDNSPIHQLQKATIPILFIHGAEDDYVPVRMAREMFEAYQGEKELFLVPGAYHATSHLQSPEAYEAKVAAFLERIGF